MTDTVAIRADIDTQTVRGLQLINGGTAAGLTALVPAVILQPELKDLAAAMIIAIGTASFGLFASVVHNRLRRKCSLEDSRGDNRSPPCRWKFFRRFQSVPNEPCICTASVMWMWASLAAFLLSAGFVVMGAWGVLKMDQEELYPQATWCIVEGFGEPKNCRFYSELHCQKFGLIDPDGSACVPRPD